MKYFFSYSRHDGEFVKQLAQDLKIRKMDVWLDQLDIPIGAKWDTCIEHALNEAAGIILVLSKSSVQSDNVMDEVSYAIEKNKHIIPILLDDCDVPFRIARIQQIFFKEHDHYNQGIETIIATIYSHNPPRQPIPAGHEEATASATIVEKAAAAPHIAKYASPGNTGPQGGDALAKRPATHQDKPRLQVDFRALLVLAVVAGIIWLYTSSTGQGLHPWIHTSSTDFTYLYKKASMPHLLIVIIVGAIAGWLAGMIVDSDSQSFLLDIVIGIAGGYIAVNWIFHGMLHITGYMWVDLTLTSTVGAVVLALIIKLIRRMTRR